MYIAMVYMYLLGYEILNVSLVLVIQLDFDLHTL